MNIIKKHFVLLLGVGLFITGFFNFSHYGQTYYYDNGNIFLLTTGSILITIWLLKNSCNK